MNILILSCGTRNKIIQYFKEELGGEGKVIATDCSELAPALYDADEFFIVPKMTEDGYLDKILSICKDKNISGVLSLIDPELILLAENKNKFLEIGVTPIISDLESIKLSFDKYRMYKYLSERKIRTVKSYVDLQDFYKDLSIDEISFPVFVKPVTGSASININKVYTKEELDGLFTKHDNLMIQEYMDGPEYGADVYIDLVSGELATIFIKEKLKMRAGETDKALSIKDNKIFNQVKELLSCIEFKGVIDVDIFEKNGEYYISEVNPRFGGGYPHAHESGVNIPGFISRNLKGIANQPRIGDYEEGIKMMKYNEVKIIRVHKN